MAFWNNIKWPYQTMQQLNLDWLLTELKRIAGFMPEDGNVGDVLMKKSEGASWEPPEAIDLNINNLPQDTEMTDTDKLVFYDVSAEANRKIAAPDMLNSMMSNAFPLMDGTASAGTSKKPARYDHRHPTDTSRQAALSSAQLAAANSGITAAKVALYDAIGSRTILDSTNTSGQLHVIGTGATNTVQLDEPIDDFTTIDLILFIDNVAWNSRTEITIGVYSQTVGATVYPIASISGVGWICIEIGATGLLTFVQSSASDVYLNRIYGNRRAVAAP